MVTCVGKSAAGNGEAEVTVIVHFAAEDHAAARRELRRERECRILFLRLLGAYMQRLDMASILACDT